MCSNFHLSLEGKAAAQEFGVPFPESVDQSYFPYRPTKSQAPAKPYSLPYVVLSEKGRRTVRKMRWGLLSHWAKSELDMPQPFNAQAEGIASKPFFRDAIRSRRCLVPASAFFDFDSTKTRYRFELPGLHHFAFAGLFNVWNEELSTFTFITAAPSPWFSKYHHRQPVTLVREQYFEWLDPASKTFERLLTVEPGELKTTPEAK